VVVAAALALLAGSAQATFEGRNGRLAFATESPPGLFTARPDGTDATTLSAEGTVPTWSPDGSKMVFAKWRSDPQQVWVMDADGSNAHAIAPGYGAEWSPDGSRIVLSRRESEQPFSFHSTLWVADADGSNLRRLTVNPIGQDDQDPHWSPDGTRIAFMRGSGRGGSDTPDVWVIDADGRNAKGLTPSNFADSSPDWSQDGGRLAFVRRKFDPGNWTKSAIWTMNPDGSNPDQVTDPPGYTDEAPDWSPDGTRIAFQRYLIGVGDPGEAGTLVVDADGSNLLRVQDGDGYNPEWSPDGTKLATVRQGHDASGYFYSLWVAGADGSDQRMVARGGPGVVTFDWQAVPFGPVAPSPAGVTFLPAPVTATMGPRAVTLVNRGDHAVHVDQAALTGAGATDFATLGDGCTNITLAPGQDCQVSVRFAPESIGTHRPTLRFSEDGGASAQYVALLGTGITQALRDPTSVDFGSVPYGTDSAPRTVELINRGGASLTIAGVTISGADAGRFSTSDDTCSGTRLRPQERCSVAVRFSPDTLGARAARLEFADDTVDSPQTVPLSGSGISSVSLTPDPLPFADTAWGSRSTAQQVTFTNRGGVNLAIGGASLRGTDAASFTIDANACEGTTVAPGGSCGVTVSFQPVGLGTKSAALRVIDDAADGPHSMTLTGKAISQVGASPAALNWQPRADSVSSPWRSITVTNRGDHGLTIAGVSLAGPDTTSFRVRDGTCVGATVAAAATCAIQARFRPDGTGPKTATVRLTDDAPNSPQVLATVYGTGLPGQWLTISAQALKFGHVRTGGTAAAKTLTLTNIGSAPMAISAIRVEGANPNDFVGLVETCTSQVALGPDQSCTAQIGFRPTASGARSAVLTVADTAPGAPHHVPLYGTGI
jgi:Tol biopolymer transport system component